MHICLDSSLTAQNPPHNPRSSLVIKAPCEWSAQGRYNLWNITWYAICSCISYIEPVCFSPSPLWKCSCVLINNTRKSAQRFSLFFLSVDILPATVCHAPSVCKLWSWTFSVDTDLIGLRLFWSLYGGNGGFVRCLWTVPKAESGQLNCMLVFLQ